MLESSKRGICVPTHGDELGRLVADKRFLTSSKLKGVQTLGVSFSVHQASLHSGFRIFTPSVRRTSIGPNLKEISLEFSSIENNSTNLTAVVSSLGKSCTRPQNIHTTLVRLPYAVVLALTPTDLRGCKCFHLCLDQKSVHASGCQVMFVETIQNQQSDNKEKEMASVLLSVLYAEVISSAQINQGFIILLDSADDLTVDILDAVGILALFIARTVVYDILPPAFLPMDKAY
ncbi:hypothetical protein F0562_008517 [Nyssa sinensis]|uniref:MI domain-containing protein n=1 Tax=Nyssa sinensis TaxID=561372 RepID=A0A5J5A735_9ASTE|nr:hypothetical protein F0562_008517 [Nyssa sinensis]